jgi:TolB protein
MNTAHRLIVFTAALLASASLAVADDQSAPAWKEAESQTLRNHVQLTFSDRFAKAGESYFSPDNNRIVFQGVETPADGEAASEFYAMYVADVVRDRNGRITGIENIICISPEGSANTCGWFHPTDPDVVLFASTVGPPTESSPPGYQRGSGRYRWMFPPEMDIVKVRLSNADRSAESLTHLVSNNEAYIAECSYSPDGRHLLYCSLESNEGDLFTKDLKTGTTTRIVSARGYDGGPFFSPDGRRICYRSDRQGNNRLQLFIGELAFNDEGTIVGLQREFQITDNEHVNWAPFWHPNGRHLVYATSEISHRSYEVFMIDADPGHRGTVKYGTNKRRITFSEGFDGLPVFDSTGKTMMWTSQRSECGTSQLWVADFLVPTALPSMPR